MKYLPVLMKLFVGFGVIVALVAAVGLMFCADVKSVKTERYASVYEPGTPLMYAERTLDAICQSAVRPETMYYAVFRGFGMPEVVFYAPLNGLGAPSVHSGALFRDIDANL